MDKQVVEFFVNDRFKVLEILNQYQMQVQEAKFSPLTQQEISEILHCSKAKINQIINELIDSGYIEFYNNTKGRYVITNKANKVLHLIQKRNI